VTVLFSKNYDKIDRIIKLAHDNNVSHVYLQPMYMVYDNHEFKQLKLSEKELFEFSKKVPKLIELAKNYNMVHNYHIFSPELVRNCETQPSKVIDNDLKEHISNGSNLFKHDLFSAFCLDFWNFMMVSPHGDIQFCLREFPFGFNIKKDRVKDVWQGNKLKEIRKNFLNGKRFYECDKCCPGKIIDNLKIKNMMRERLSLAEIKN